MKWQKKNLQGRGIYIKEYLAIKITYKWKKLRPSSKEPLLDLRGIARKSFWKSLASGTRAQKYLHILGI